MIVYKLSDITGKNKEYIVYIEDYIIKNEGENLGVL